jgi:DNA-binding NarL/FixJ family response regulator
MKTARVLLADDHALVRAGIRSLWKGCPGIEAVAEAGDGYSCSVTCFGGGDRT